MAVLAIAVIVLALTNLPYLWGTIINFEGQVFSGFVYTFTFYDILSYLAKMREGLEGGWFYTNPFTTEEPKPVFLFVFYITLGHVARLAGLSLVATYHVARVAAGVFLLVSADRMIRRIGWSGPSRLFAFALVFFGGGFGWLLHWMGWVPVPVEFMQTEGFIFQSMLSYPHFVLTLALMIWILTDAWSFGGGQARWTTVAGSAGAAFILAWVHPRPLLTIVVTSALAALWGAATGRWSVRRWGIFLAVLVLVSAGPMAVSLMTVRADPLWTEWSKTETLSAAPWRYLLAYGLMWPLAIAGLVRGGRKGESWIPLLGSWLIAASFLPFLPIAAQGRLIIGWNIPLALLAGYALGDQILPRLQGAAAPISRTTPAMVSVLILLLSLSTVAYLGLGVRRVLMGAFPGYYSQDRAEAMDWLATNTQPDETVLSSVLSGMFIPAFSGNRVVQGHWAETFNPEEKAAKAEIIFDKATPDEIRHELLNEFRVAYLLYGQWERDMGEYDPGSDPGLWELRWMGKTTSIYERNR